MRGEPTEGAVRTANEAAQSVRYWPTGQACQTFGGCLAHPSQPGRCLYCDSALPVPTVARRRVDTLINLLLGGDR